MKRSLHTVLCLATGILIGSTFTGRLADQQNAIQSPINNSSEYASQICFYDNMIEEVGAMQIVDASELSEKELTNRNGKLLVEKVIGEVQNYRLDGKILNASTGNGNYINYERVDGAKEGDMIVTYFIYNPFTNAPDDILTRLDFIIDSNSI